MIDKMTKAVVALLVMSGSAFAQTSAYQTADSNTSIFLTNANANLIFNVSDSRFTVGYLHEEAGRRTVLFGFDLTGTPSASLATQLFQKGPNPPALGGAASIGLHSMFALDPADQSPDGHLRDDWALIQFTYSRSSFNLTNDPNSQPQQVHFDEYKVLAVYNALVNAPHVGLLLGGAVGVHRTNNLNDLEAVTINTPVLQSSAGVSPAFQAVRQDNGYFGDYETGIGIPIYTDVVIIPKRSSWINLDLFTRSSAAAANRYFEGGVGLFIAKPDNPTAVLGGLTVGWSSGVPTWALVAGWSF